MKFVDDEVRQGQWNQMESRGVAFFFLCNSVGHQADEIAASFLSVVAAAPSSSFVGAPSINLRGSSGGGVGVDDVISCDAMVMSLETRSKCCVGV